MSTIKRRLAVVAFGGNALLRPEDRGTQEEQIARAKQAARWLADIARQGYKLIVVHGNGPQVGNILVQAEEASTKIPPQSLDVCVARTPDGDAPTREWLQTVLDQAESDPVRKRARQPRPGPRWRGEQREPVLARPAAAERARDARRDVELPDVRRRRQDRELETVQRREGEHGQVVGAPSGTRTTKGERDDVALPLARPA